MSGSGSVCRLSACAGGCIRRRSHSRDERALRTDRIHLVWRRVVALVCLAAVVDYAISVVQACRLIPDRSPAFATGAKRGEDDSVYWVSFSRSLAHGDEFAWGRLVPGDAASVRGESTTLPQDWFRWTVFADMQRRDSHTVQRLVGLPWRSWTWSVETHGRREVPADGVVRVSGGIVIQPVQPRTWYSAVRVIPTRMRPLAWVSNVAGLALLLAGGHAAFVRVRERSRTSRGRCARCGYAVGELAQCPECGRSALRGT